MIPARLKLEEINKICSEIRNGKEPRPEDVPWELLKHYEEHTILF